MIVIGWCKYCISLLLIMWYGELKSQSEKLRWGCNHIQTPFSFT